MTEETETERLSRECREMYDELSTKGLIEGTYAQWLEASSCRTCRLVSDKKYRNRRKDHSYISI